jgi:hypothetical protein
MESLVSVQTALLAGAVVLALVILVVLFRVLTASDTPGSGRPAGRRR